MNIIIRNNGQDIRYTDYWISEHARAGFLFLSINAGAFRLLVPAAQETQIADMYTAKEVVISRGPWPDTGKHDAIEMMFEDFSDSPFVIHLGSEQCDRMPVASDRHGAHVLSVWTSAGKQLELPAYFRIVNQIPYMIPWLKPRKQD